MKHLGSNVPGYNVIFPLQDQYKIYLQVCFHLYEGFVSHYGMCGHYQIRIDVWIKKPHNSCNQ